MTDVMLRFPDLSEDVRMQLLDELRREHDLIERLLGSLRTCASRFVEADALEFLEVLEAYAGRWHHEREEGVLFQALQSQAMLPANRGPIAVMVRDHESFGAMLKAMREAIREPRRFEQLAIDYSAALWHHIDAENSVLFPESEQQLRSNGVYELALREMPPATREAERRAEALIDRYPAGESDVIRGEGCAMCAAYGDACRGLEREWWNDWQWEELDEHVAAS